MARCSVCGTDSPGSAHYCANCGSVLEQANAPSAFEYGRITALESVKSEILKWLGVPLAILTAVVGFLGYLGISNTINSEVQSQVEKEIDKNLNSTSHEIMKRFIKISHQEDAIDRMEKRSNNELAGLQSIKKQLVASEQELQNRLSAMEMGPFLAKLSYDFYHLRDFAVSGYIDLKPAMSPDLDRDLDYSEYVTLVGDSNDSLGPVRLERDRASKQPTETGITGINIQFSPLTIAEQNKVIGKHINMLTHINKIKLVFYCNTND